MILFDMFVSFFKTGLLSFGGGYAMISMLCSEAVNDNWMNIKDFFDIVAISQITPGPIAINMATFVGFKKCGIIGSIICTLGVSLPSFLLVIILLHFISKFNNSFFVQNLFYGLKPAVVSLIAATVIQIAWSIYLPDANFFEFPIDFKSIRIIPILISILSFIALYKFKLNIIAAILIFAAVGIIIL